jgi:hypothetical protein
MAISDTPQDARVGMSLRELATLDRAPKLPPEKEWWNLPAKYRAVQRIKGEMLRQFPGHDDGGDAVRHAELSRRMAVDIDPVTAAAAGLMHEIDNTVPRAWVPSRPAIVHRHADENWWGQRWPERDMDMHNNLEGLRAGMSHRPIDRRVLQTRPAQASAPLPPYGERSPSRRPER